MSRPPSLVAVMGPTASGKSDVAEKVADELGYALLSADAFMVYTGLDVGTNKPLRKHDYALIDIIGPQEEFGVGEYVVRAADALHRLWNEGRGAVIVGGTGFYVRALLEQYDDLMPPPDPELRAELMSLQDREGLAGLAGLLADLSPEIARTIDAKNPVRVRRALERLRDPRPAIEFKLPPYLKAKFVLDPSGIDEAIETRTAKMLEEGWVEEVVRILGENVERSAPGFRAIGYDCVIGIVQGSLTREEAEKRIVQETRQYSRRQRTWLRSEPHVSKVFTGEVGTEFSEACAKEIVDFVCV